MSRRLKLGSGLAAFAIFAAVAWYLGSPLFINRSVNEAFPVEIPSREEVEKMSSSEVKMLEDQFEAAMPSEAELAAMPEPQRKAIEEKAMDFMAVMPDKMAAETKPASSSPEIQPVLQGSFQDADSFHMGSGDALIYRLPDGTAVLRLEDFEVTNGPDLHVLLASGSPNPASSEELGEYLDLGSLKGTIGNQNYEIPPATDLSMYQSVVIYCVPFHVVFSTAALH